MEVIAVEFTGRRYHATPWDAHVNEGRIEWPPCAWRLLRALISVGYNKHGWVEGPPETAVSLLKKLAASNPRFSLPKAVETHTRHYMPSRSGSTEKPVKVFDSFLRFSDAAEHMLVQYDVTLDAEERAELVTLARGLSYLGRAESWVEAELLAAEAANAESARRTWCTLAEAGSGKRIQILAPLTSAEYDQWRESEAAAAADKAEATARSIAEAKGKTLNEEAKREARQRAESLYPTDLIAALQQDASSWQSAGWPRPPGSRWVDYAVPAGTFERRPLAAVAPSPTFEEPEAVLLTIDGEGERGTLRPRMRDALRLMELLHSEAVRHAARLKLGHLPGLTGTDADQTPLRAAHVHAHWIPLSFSGNSSIDHVLVYAPGRFSREDVQAISAIRWAYAKGIRSLAVNMVGQGSIKDISQQLRRFAKIDRSMLAVVAESTVWQSATPLVLRKFLHRRGKKTVEGQVREELQERGFPEPARITIWPNQRLVARKLKGFVLRRKPGKQQPPCDRSWGITIRFKRPVYGPICLGYAGHYGLGLFRASHKNEMDEDDNHPAEPGPATDRKTR